MSEVKHNTDAVLLGADELPAYCPHAAMPIWSSHPRVFLDMSAHGEAKCPYCGTVYRLKPGTVLKGH
ncbi:MAG: zinc-finger domain-containing protein [Pseudomonadota bacterium]|jgi:uncharacterized Zn-finger protein